MELDNRKYAKQALAIFDRLNIFISDVKESPRGTVSIYNTSEGVSHMVCFTGSHIQAFEEIEGDEVLMVQEEYKEVA